MTPALQILDGDRESLEQRVARALAGFDNASVSRFTLWYTSRPPVYGAVIRAAASA